MIGKTPLQVPPHLAQVTPVTKAGSTLKTAGTVAALGVAIGVTTIAFMHNWDSIEKGLDFLGQGGKSDYAQDTKQVNAVKYREELLTPAQRSAARQQAQQADEADVNVVVIPADVAQPRASTKQAQTEQRVTTQAQAHATQEHIEPRSAPAKQAHTEQSKTKPVSALQELGWAELATTAPTPKAAPSWESEGQDLLHKRIKANEKKHGYGYNNPAVHEPENINLESQYKKLGHNDFCAKYGTNKGKWFCNDAESSSTMVYSYDGNATKVAAR